MVIESAMAPKGMNQAAIAVAVQMGLEVGLSPMQAIQSTAVINGRPAIYGDAALGLCRASGLVEEYDECECDPKTDAMFRELCLETDQKKKKELRIAIAKAQATAKKDADDFGVTAFVKRVRHEPQFSRFTVADAKKAGLWGKAGPWVQYPTRMLKFRARGFGLRDNFGDVLKGLRTVEEMDPVIVDAPATSPASAEQPMATQTEILAAKLRSRAAQIPPTEPAAETNVTAEPQAEADDTTHLSAELSRGIAHCETNDELTQWIMSHQSDLATLRKANQSAFLLVNDQIDEKRQSFAAPNDADDGQLFATASDATAERR